MDLIKTTIALAVGTFMLIAAIALDRRPYRPGKFNYIPIMILCLAACLVLGRHLLALVMHQ